MNYVGIRELKANLGRYLRAVEAGNTLTVTTRKRPIARIVPLKKRGRDIDEILNDLAQAGFIRRALRKRFPIRRPFSIPHVRITEAVLEDRGAIL